MKGFSKEWKEYEKAYNKLFGDRSEKGYSLSELTKRYRKLLCDLALGLVDTGERIKISEQMKQYEQDIKDINFALEELEERKNILKKQGLDQVEIKDR
jgi:type II secretory pathway component PulF